MQEQTDITNTENGDASPIMKPEPARVPSNIHNHPDYNIKDKPARNDGTGDTTHISSDHSHSREPSNFSSNSNGNLVYDPGGNDVDTEDGSTRGDSDSDSSNRSRNTHSLKPSDFGIGINSNSKFVYDLGGSSFDTKDDSTHDVDDSAYGTTATNTHRSHDRDRDKTIASPANTNANAVNGSSSSSISNNTASIADTCHIPPAPRLGSNDAIIAHDDDDGGGGNSIINTYGTDSNNNSISSSISDNTPRFVDTTRALNTDAVTSSIADTARTLDTNHADTKSNTSSHSRSNATFAASIVDALTLNTIATACDNEPKHKCARILPLVVIPQVPPIAAPQLDKPEEPPPVPPKNATPAAPTRRLCKTLAPSASTPRVPLIHPTTRALVSAAQHPVSHRQRTIPATESTIDGLTQEGQFSKHPGGVMTGYVLGSECPKPDHRPTRPTPQGSARCCHSFSLSPSFP